MFLYLLEQTPKGLGYEEIHGFVIRAKNPAKARLIASENCHDEGKTVWRHCSLKVLGTAPEEAPEEVVLREYDTLKSSREDVVEITY